jgi:hypothetical protein
MCLMPRIYLTAIYGDSHQQDAPESDVPEPGVLPEQTPQPTDEHSQELIPHPPWFPRSDRLRFARLRDPDPHQLKLVQNHSHG